jgi:hypothetical protein
VSNFVGRHLPDPIAFRAAVIRLVPAMETHGDFAVEKETRLDALEPADFPL